MTLEEIEKVLGEVNGNLWELPEEIPLEEVEDGDWVNDGKYDILQNAIIVDNETGKFYRIDAGRAGSYYSDYETYFHGVTEVKQVEVKKLVWVAVP